MSIFLRLLGIQFNQRFGISALRAGFRDEKKKTLGRLAIALVAIASIGSLLGMYAWLVSKVVPAFQMLGMEQILLGILFLACMIFVFFMGFIYLIGVLFFSRDAEFLASLPISQRTVFAAKFSQVLLGEIGTAILLLGPPCIVYGITLGVGAGFWLRLVVAILLTPCIPLALSALLSLVLMRFTALWRRRELLTTIGSVILMVVIIGGQMFLTSRLPDEMSDAGVLALITDNSALLSRIASAFPPSGWAARGLAGDVPMLLLFAGVSLVALLAVVWIAGRVYHRGAMAQLESVSRQKTLRLSGRTVRQHSSLFALFLREWRCVLRSPIYALNGLVSIVMGPLMLLLPLLMQGGGGMENDFGALLQIAEQAVDRHWVLLVLAAIITFIAGINPAGASSLSREGKVFYLLRLIPVTPTRQVMAKFLFGLSVSVLAATFMAVSAYAALGFAGWMVALATLLALLASVSSVVLSMLPDLIRPKLLWNSETEAIKQNFTALIGTLLSMAYLFLLCLACFLMARAGVAAATITWTIALICAVLAVGSLWLLCKVAVSTWRRVEG